MKLHHLKPFILKHGLDTLILPLGNFYKSGGVFDYSYNGNNGVVTNAVPKCPGFYFDGTGDKIILASSASLNVGTGSFSVSAFIKPNSDVTTYRYIINKEGADNWTGWELYLNITTGVLVMACRDKDDATETAALYTVSTTSFSDSTHANKWWFITAVVNRTANTIQIYKNGVADGSAGDLSAWTTGNLDNTGDMEIGYSDGTSDFYGSIGDVVLTKRILTSAQIMDIFQIMRGKYSI